MRICIKPVKFGDCCIIYYNDQGLLVDCGSDNSSGKLNSDKFAYSKIEDEISNHQITDILITHYHKDHINGILNIPDCYQVEHSYLPYSIVDKQVPFAKGIARLLAVAPDQSWGLRLSKTILLFFEKIERISNQIVFLKRGKSIKFDDNSFRVLWPEVMDSIAFNHFRRDVPEDKICRQITLLDEEYSENSLHNSFIEITDNSDLIGSAQEFASLFSNAIRKWDPEADMSREDFLMSGVIEMANVLEKGRKEFRASISERQLETVAKFSSLQYHELIKTMNAISTIIDYESKFLLLGDATPSVLVHIRGEFEPQYDYIKVQHHGTDRFFVKDMPSASIKLISNGGYMNRKVSEKYIGENKIVCTDAHNNPKCFCGYYEANCCCSPKCTRLSGSHDVLF